MQEHSQGQMPSDYKFLMWGLLAWAYMAALSFVNGAAKELLLEPWFGESWALPLSGVTALIMFYVLIWYFMCCVIMPQNRWALWVMGGVWVLLCFIMHMIVQVGISGVPVHSVWNSYSLRSMAEGNLALPGMIMLFIAPALMAKLRRRYAGR